MALDAGLRSHGRAAGCVAGRGLGPARGPCLGAPDGRGRGRVEAGWRAPTTTASAPAPTSAGCFRTSRGGPHAPALAACGVASARGRPCRRRGLPA
eukprot:4676714-Pyramimonas_sp.AAC.1